MDLSSGYRLLVMMLIIGINGFFASAETALVSVRASRLRQMAEQGVVGASAALSLLANPERLLSVVQVGVTLTSLALGWVGEDTLYTLFQGWLEPWMTPVLRGVFRVAILVVSFALMTFMHVVIGEVVPKNLAIDKADRLAIIVAPALLVFYKVAEPFVWAIERASTSLSRLIGVKGEAHAGSHSHEELKFIVAASQGAGLLSSFESKSIERLLELRDYVVREVMVPRNKLTMIPVDADIDDLLKVFSETRYSRLPVFEGEADNVLGAVHVKDVLDIWTLRRKATALRRSVPPFNLRKIIRQAPLIPETKPMDQVMDQFRASHTHLAFVVDEYGSLAGLLTVEDVIEQVFGEIGDEFDGQPIQRALEAHQVEVEGTISLVDLDSHYGIEIPAEEEYETLAGFLLYKLERIPRVNDLVKHGERTFRVLEMDRNRVARVEIEKQEAKAED